jgi:hypothetical protein
MYHPSSFLLLGEDGYEVLVLRTLLVGFKWNEKSGRS